MAIGREGVNLASTNRLVLAASDEAACTRDAVAWSILEAAGGRQSAGGMSLGGGGIVVVRIATRRLFWEEDAHQNERVF